LYAGIHNEIVSAYPERNQFRHWQAYAGRDPAPVAAAVAQFHMGQMLRVDRLERAMSRLLDEDTRLPNAILSTIRDYSHDHEFTLVEAQAERGLGRIQQNPDRLKRSISLFDQAGASPYVARVRCERALISGDGAEMKAGLDVLERLGDAEQLGRFERLQVG
jgi:hypothetical protein